MKSSRLSYSLLLPLLVLVVWAVLVPTPAFINYLHLLRVSNGADPVHLHFGAFGAVVPHSRLFLFCLNVIGFSREHWIMAMNIPGIFIEILISLPTTWPMTWHPAGMYESWRAVAYPFYCLPWWWFVGRSADALAGRKKIGWISLLVGGLLCLCCAVAGVAAYLTDLPSDRIADLWLELGFVFWACIFAIVPLAWWMQRRRLRNAPIKNSTIADDNGAAEAAPLP